MEIFADMARLRHHLKRAASVAGGDCGTVSLEARNGGLALKVDSHGVTTITPMEAVVVKPGDFRVDLENLRRACGALTSCGEPSALVYGGAERLTLQGERAAVSLRRSDVWPGYGVDPPKAHRDEVDVGVLRHCVSKVRHAAGDNQAWGIRGVRVEADGVQMRAIATDGRRMAVCERECSRGVNAFLSAEAVNFLCGIPVKCGDAASVCTDDGAGVVEISCAGRVGRFSLPVSTYPLWRNCVPSGVEVQAVLPARAVTAALRGRMAAYGGCNPYDGDTWMTHIRCSGSGVTVRSITTKDPRSFESEIEDAPGQPSGEAFEAVVNALHLADALGAMDGDVQVRSVSRNIVDNPSPILLTPLADAGYFEVVSTCRKM